VKPLTEVESIPTLTADFRHERAEVAMAASSSGRLRGACAPTRSKRAAALALLTGARRADPTPLPPCYASWRNYPQRRHIRARDRARLAAPAGIHHPAEVPVSLARGQAARRTWYTPRRSPPGRGDRQRKNPLGGWLSKTARHHLNPPSSGPWGTSSSASGSCRVCKARWPSSCTRTRAAAA